VGCGGARRAAAARCGVASTPRSIKHKMMSGEGASQI
jgi:hypothetical protein